MKSVYIRENKKLKYFIFGINENIEKSSEGEAK